MLYGAESAVRAEINTKHINTVWAECQFLSVKPVGACNQLALKVKQWQESGLLPCIHTSPMSLHTPARCLYTHQPDVCTHTRPMSVHTPGRCLYTHQADVCTHTSPVSVHTPARCLYTHQSDVSTHTRPMSVHTPARCL
jgi:hypothetical protein